MGFGDLGTESLLNQGHPLICRTAQRTTSLFQLRSGARGPGRVEGGTPRILATTCCSLIGWTLRGRHFKPRKCGGGALLTGTAAGVEAAARVPRPCGSPDTRPLPPTTHLRAMGPEPATQKQPPPRRRSRRASGLSAGGAAGSSADSPDPRPEGR